MCALTDGATMSGKKDSLVNIGGWLGLNDAALAEKARNLVVLFEGLHTYGGLAGRDMEAMAIGIEESVQDDHIRARIGQVHVPRATGSRTRACRSCGRSAGTRCSSTRRRCFRTCRASSSRRRRSPRRCTSSPASARWSAARCRRGAIPATGENRVPALELVRLTIPAPRLHAGAHGRDGRERRWRCARSASAWCGLRFTYEPEYLRFFQARFEPVGGGDLRRRRFGAGDGSRAAVKGGGSAASAVSGHPGTRRLRFRPSTRRRPPSARRPGSAARAPPSRAAGDRPTP